MLVLIRDEHQHGGRKPTETPVTEFCYRNANLLLEELIYSQTRSSVPVANELIIGVRAIFCHGGR